MPICTATMEKDKINALFASFQHSTLHQNLIEMDAIRECKLIEGTLAVSLALPFAWHSGYTALKRALTPKLHALTGAQTIQWSCETRVATLQRANPQAPVKNIKNIIAISSGKGGVGKSSTAVNLALALQKEGARVGLLDADIYGPSIPSMLGTRDAQILSPNQRHMLPVMAFDMPTHSIGYLVDRKNATVWRGPMASKALLQILSETLWPELDYLIIDMPPGTGDIQLTLAQSIPVTAAVIITTPQDIALMDAEKGLAMFRQIRVPTLGIIENMSYHICDHCQHQEAIFGEGGAQKLATEYQTMLLGQIPLHKTMREDLDQGTPTVIRRPESFFTELYSNIASRVAAELYWQGTVISDDIAITHV